MWVQAGTAKYRQKVPVDESPVYNVQFGPTLGANCRELGFSGGAQLPSKLRRRDTLGHPRISTSAALSSGWLVGLYLSSSMSP